MIEAVANSKRGRSQHLCADGELGGTGNHCSHVSLHWIYGSFGIRSFEAEVNFRRSGAHVSLLNIVHLTPVESSNFEPS